MFVGCNDLLNRIHKNGLGDGWHLQSVSPSLHSTSVFFGSEKDDPVFRSLVSFHALKQALAVIENARSGRHGDVAVGA